MKITGAAAARKYDFERTVKLGRSVNSQVVSIGSALDHCHVPGRQGNEAIPKDVAIVGAGIHNEPVGETSITEALAELLLTFEYRALKGSRPSRQWKS